MGYYTKINVHTRNTYSNRFQNAFRASTLRWKGVPFSEYIPIKKSELRYTRPLCFYPLPHIFFSSLNSQQHFPTFQTPPPPPLYFWLFTFFPPFTFSSRISLPSFLRFLQQLLQHFSKELETPIIFHSTRGAWIPRHFVSTLKRRLSR